MIPEERLPPGFVRSVEHPPAPPAEPHPAATVVLLREAADGPEVLLLRRHRATAFVPGAWVFPGGRVDAGDAAFAASGRAVGAVEPPRASFWAAAAREAFEETGVLLARDAGGSWLGSAAGSPQLEEWRERLMKGDIALAELIAGLDATLDLRHVVHCAHWITPVVEPRRYDTHFFLAELPEGAEVRPDAREMTAAAWLTPAGALERFRAGQLPMVFPTVRTLESLRSAASVAAALDSFRGAAIPTILPRLVRRPGGVTIEI